MSIGTAIVVSSLLLSGVLLFGFTRNRWNWRRLLILGLVFVSLLAGGMAGLLFWNHRGNEVRRSAEVERLRSLHEVRIGDPYTRVLQRQGRPDTLFAIPEDEVFVAGYRDAARPEWVKVFAFRPDSSVKEIRFFGDGTRNIRFLWMPADGVTLGVNRSMVEAALGPPCEEEIERRHTRLVFRALESDGTLNPLAANSLAGDSTRSLLRYVWAEHGTGTIISHGWLLGACPPEQEQDH